MRIGAGGLMSLVAGMIASTGLDFGGNIPGEYVKHGQDKQKRNSDDQKRTITEADRKAIEAAAAKRARRGRQQDQGWKRA